ncbi:MAG: DUF5654 family protein [Patescibacteria group bacterium]|jgi:hypothetical protein|nr:DUF5654 family protein [Patescibacteria group bacterium]
MTDTRTNSEKEKSLRLMVLSRIYELMTAAFSLVAALAWNDAIQALFNKLFGSTNTLVAKFGYAILVTFVIVWLGIRLSRTAKTLEKLLSKDKIDNN